MGLARSAWKLLVGIKDALVLIFMLLFFGLLYAAMSARPGHSGSRSGALVLHLNGVVVEQPAPVDLSSSLSGRETVRQFRTRDVVRGIEAAATDSRAKAVVLDLDRFAGGGQVALEEIGAALDKVKKAGKPVIAYATAYTDDAYLLAAHASDVAMDPMGEAFFTGPGGQQLYLKGLIDKLGVTAHVYRVGKYKSAVEPVIRSDMSPEAREEYRALLNARWENWLINVTTARPKAKVRTYAADPAGQINAGILPGAGSLASAAVAAGLVDRLVTPQQLDDSINKIVGDGRRGQPYAAINFARWLNDHPAPESGKVAVVTVAGTIQDGDAPAGTAGGDTIARIINKAVDSERYKALVLRVDSGGGSAMASERIRLALADAKAKGLPVVASMGDVAASGGYWVTTAADKVFAEPSTITGSIGVFGIFPTIERTLAKVGLTTDGVATTPLSGQPSMAAGTNPAFDAIVQRGVEDIYSRFVQLVSTARHLTPQRVDEIGQGRVWDGGTAHQIGLVDQFGGVRDAIAAAAVAAKLDPKTTEAVWLEAPNDFSSVLGAIISGAGGDEDDDSPDTGDAFAVLKRMQAVQLSAAAHDAATLFGGATIQARCLGCPTPVTAANDHRPSRLIDLILAWINA